MRAGGIDRIPTWFRSLGGAAACGAAIAFAFAVWITSPRFKLDAPSLIDDWAGIARAPRALHGLLTFTYDNSFDAQRFRPAYWGVWNSLQWHTLGAPHGMLGPNLWNLARIAFLVGGLSLVVYATVGARTREGIGWPGMVLLTAAPGALLVSTPAIAVDLARFGPQEPLELGCLLVGGTGLLAVLRDRLRSAGERRWTLPMTLLIAIPSTGVWLVGVYSKEAAICFLVLVPFLGVAARGRISKRSLPSIAVIGAVLLVPVLHVALEARSLSRGGTVVYGATVPHGVGQWAHRIENVLKQQWRAMPDTLGTRQWTGLVYATPLMLLAAGLRGWRQRLWIPLGLLITALAVFVFQGLPEGVTPRYYIPSLALLAAVCAIALAHAPPGMRAIAAVGLAVALVSNASPAHRLVRSWVADERLRNSAVTAVASVDPVHCPTYYVGFPEEAAAALPVLAKLRSTKRRSCESAAFLVTWKLVGTADDPYIHQACAPPGWQLVNQNGAVLIEGCRRLQPGSLVLAGPAGPMSVATDLRARRLVPADS